VITEFYQLRRFSLVRSAPPDAQDDESLTAETFYEESRKLSLVGLVAFSGTEDSTKRSRAPLWGVDPWTKWWTVQL